MSAPVDADVYFHGGKAGLRVGDSIIPGPPAAPMADDGCPVCIARREGRVYTFGEYRGWLATQGEGGQRVLAAIADAPDSVPVDPPSARNAVYITTERDYARWYAARSKGDLYRVDPDGELEPSNEDSFPTFTVGSATIVEVIDRGVRLVRSDRRRLDRKWSKADRKHAALSRLLVDTGHAAPEPGEVGK